MPDANEPDDAWKSKLQTGILPMWLVDFIERWGRKTKPHGEYEPEGKPLEHPEVWAGTPDHPPQD